MNITRHTRSQAALRGRPQRKRSRSSRPSYTGPLPVESVVDDCVICSCSLTPESGIETLSCCKQTFHLGNDLTIGKNLFFNFYLECLKLLQKPSCPLCRAPITPNGNLTIEDVNIMAKHVEKNRRAHNEQALRMFFY